MVALKKLTQRINGFGTLMSGDIKVLDNTTEEYASEQMEGNVDKTRSYLLPLIDKYDVRTAVDLGCGVGTMVTELLNHGIDAYGVDLISLNPFWEKMGHDKDRFFFVDPYKFELPFADNSIDFAFSFGVIEHIGTSDGHADRMTNYHELRKNWLREVYRVLKPGGKMLIGGPNRNFPIDTAHGPDSKASRFELMLSRWAGATVHKTWGENFLWSYADFPDYLSNLAYKLEPLSVNDFVYFSRVPKPFRTLTQFYIKHLPKSLLGTGFNPWVMALVEKGEGK